MTELFRTLRLAFYVCALPLIATAIASAHTWVHDDAGNTPPQELPGVPARPTGVGLEITDTVLAQPHVLRVDATGGVSGRVVTREAEGVFGSMGMNVSLNVRGRTYARAMTQEDGTFRFNNVQPGSYTFIANSPTSISTFGVYVIADEQVIPEADEIQVDAVAANRNVDEVRSLLNSDIEQPPKYTYTPAVDELLVQAATTQVIQNQDGSLNGRVVPLNWIDGNTPFDVTGNRVYLYNSNGLAAEVAVESDGSYRIENAEPGIYDFVSFGPHGAAALSVQVQAFDPVAAGNSNPPFSLASNRISQEGIDVVLSEPTAAGPIDVQLVINQPPMMPAGGGGGGGYGGYGGGGYGGMGNWGDLIGLAIAAWAISEATNNRNEVVTPPVVIPPNVSPF